MSIGLPVFNGERYLPAALGSLLRQTYTDFELLIQDNASTDRTAEMCQRFAATDRRIAYQRNPENLGAAANYNRVLDRARGRYFKWAAHDDICKPRFLEVCVEVLDNDNSVVLSHAHSEAIDENGRTLGRYADEPQALETQSWQRFNRLILGRHYCIPVFGVMRTSILEKTARHGNWVGADRNLLAELALYGRIRLVDEVLFQRRHHAESSISKYPDERLRTAWFQGEADSIGSYPTWRRLKEYLRGIRRAPLSARERLFCRAVLLKWLAGRHHTGAHNAALLARELIPMSKTG